MKYLFYLSVFCFSISKSYSQVQVTELSNYLFPEFTNGIVLMKNGKENKAMLNFNTVTEQMIFKDKNQILALGPTDIQLIDTIFIRDKKFCALNNTIVELIIKSTYDLFAENKCKTLNKGKETAYGGTSETAATTSYGSMGYGGRNINLDVSENYEYKPYSQYWLRKNGNLKKFNSIKQLMKFYGKEKDLFKSYVKENNVNFENRKDVVQLIEYMEKQ